MRKKKIFILLGHPDSDTLSGALADAYEAGALSAGHEVRRQNVHEMYFDPILHKGYKVIQALEPDLVSFQENVKWSDHFVVVYPNWWCTMPALLKGVFDRAWLPGFAFKFNESGIFWQKLLKGKTARVIICAATHEFIITALFGDFTNELARATLGFAGFRTKVSVFSPSEKTSKAGREGWKRNLKRLGFQAL